MHEGDTSTHHSVAICMHEGDTSTHHSVAIGMHEGDTRTHQGTVCPRTTCLVGQPVLGRAVLRTFGPSISCLGDTNLGGQYFL